MSKADKLMRLAELSLLAIPLESEDEKQTAINNEFFLLCCELVPLIFLSCQNKAEWELSDGSHDVSYSCTDCLSDAVAIETIEIRKVDDIGKCNFVGNIYSERFFERDT